MGRMKDFAMDVSEELGFDGELNDEVLEEAQGRLDDRGVDLVVRTGEGTVNHFLGEMDFTDVVEHVTRCPRQHSGWRSVFYKGERYQLKGGIRTGYFICLNNPIMARISSQEIAGVP